MDSLDNGGYPIDSGTTAGNDADDRSDSTPLLDRLPDCELVARHGFDLLHRGSQGGTVFLGAAPPT